MKKRGRTFLDPQFPALDAHILYCVRHANAAKKGEIPLDRVGIHAKDEKTLIVELEHPTPHFLQITASNSLYPINQTQELHFPNWFADAGEHFVCNGPFKLSQWKHHNKILLEKNKRYRLADQVRLDEIQISIIDNESATLHIARIWGFRYYRSPHFSLPLDAYPDLIQKLLHLYQAPGTMACMFNTKKFPFYNTNMRKAFSYAINRQLLIDNITQLQESPALGIVPPYMKKSQTQPHFEDGNVELARKHFQKGLEELGIQPSDLNGKTTFSYWSHDHACPMLPQAMQQQWREVLGVEVELEALEYKTLHEKGKNGLLSMGYFVFLSMYQDPIELLDRFKNAQNTRNYARWQNDTYADLLTRSAQSSTQEEHFALLDQAEKIMIDEMPYAPIFHWNYALLVQPHVKGFDISPLGYFCFDKVFIEKKSGE